MGGTGTLIFDEAVSPGTPSGTHHQTNNAKSSVIQWPTPSANVPAPVEATFNFRNTFPESTWADTSRAKTPKKIQGAYHLGPRSGSCTLQTYGRMNRLAVDGEGGWARLAAGSSMLMGDGASACGFARELGSAFQVVGKWGGRAARVLSYVNGGGRGEC